LFSEKTMRTDVKIGLICGLFVVGSGVAYFAFPTLKEKGTSTATVMDRPQTGGPVIAGPAETPAATPAPAAPTHHSLFGPSVAVADTPPTPAPAPATAPAGLGAPSPAPSTPAPGNTLVLEPPPPAGSKPTTISTPATPTGLGGPVINPPAPTGVSIAPPGPSAPPSFGAVPTPAGPTLQLDTPAAATAGGTTYVIKKGDSFARIAKANFGNQKPATIKAIQDANPGLDSQHLKIGKTINLPSLPSTATASVTPPATPTTPEAPGGPTTRPASSHKHRTASATTAPAHSALAGGTYTVKKGDDLHKIAKAVYGDERRWRQIARTNRDILADPDNLEVGTVLRLPPAQ
jgi:LysM repeat protein